MKTNQDYKVHYKVANSDYGIITVPKGTRLTHQTAMGHDRNYHFVSDLSWVKKNYPKIANLLMHDLTYHGIDVPKKFVDYE